jgi:hypothetical protein
MIERHAIGDAPAAVVADDREAGEPSWAMTSTSSAARSRLL